MKIFTLVIVLTSFLAKAQDSLQVTEQNKSFSLGNRNAFILEIPQATVKNTKSDWKSYLRSNTKRSTSEKDGELVLPKGTITDITSDSVTVFSTVTSAGPKSILTVFFLKNDSSYISSSTNASAANAASFFMRKFGISEYKNAVLIELKQEIKKSDDLEKKVSNLESENENFRKKIDQNDRFVSRTRDDIKANEADQVLKSNNIVEQKTLLNHFTGTAEQLKIEDKKLKSMTKELEKLRDNKDKLLDKISGRQSDNRDYQKSIDKNLSETIPAAKGEVSQQKFVVTAIQNKLTNIK